MLGKSEECWLDRRRERKAVGGTVGRGDTRDVARDGTSDRQRVARSRLENAVAITGARSHDGGTDGRHPEQTNKPRDRARARQAGQDHDGSIETNGDIRSGLLSASLQEKGGTKREVSNRTDAWRGGAMTTSRETDWMDHPVLRKMVDEANRLPVAERVTLLKGIIPGIAREMTPKEFEAVAAELRLKGERFYEAIEHPGEGRATRQVIGERDLEGR